MTNDMVEFVSVCRISEDYNGRILKTVIDYIVMTALLRWTR